MIQQIPVTKILLCLILFPIKFYQISSVAVAVPILSLYDIFFALNSDNGNMEPSYSEAQFVKTTNGKISVREYIGKNDQGNRSMSALGRTKPLH